MNKTFNYILLLVVLSLVSCEEQKDKSQIVRNKNTFSPDLQHQISFPDTVKVGTLNNGNIYYKSVFDTIITTFGDPLKNRYTRFIMSTTADVNYDFHHLKTQIVRDTFGAVTNTKIPFYDVQFEKKGIYFIDGILNDIVIIDLDSTDAEGKELARFIEIEDRITKKVVVTD